MLFIVLNRKKLYNYCANGYLNTGIPLEYGAISYC